nr:putative pseudogene (Abc transporter n-terminal) transmembrane protein [Ralstonia solanacearum]
MSDTLPIGHWVDQALHDLLDHDAAAFDTVGRAIEGLAALIERSLQAVPMWMMMAFFIGIGLFPAASLHVVDLFAQRRSGVREQRYCSSADAGGRRFATAGCHDRLWRHSHP